MARGVGKCPRCGTPVSQFAAGCAVCGEDLVAARAARAERPSLPSVGAPSWLGSDAFMVAILFLLALFAPLFGLLLAGFIAYRADQDSQVRMRNLAGAAAAVALVLLLVPDLRWGVWAIGSGA